jgi:multidrug resistance efflux pump
MPAIWAACAILAAWLYFRSPDYDAAPGIAEVVEFDLSPVQNERVQSVLVVPGQRVRKGEPVAVFDPGPVQRELDVVAAELKEAEGNLAAALAGARVTLKQARTFESGLEEAESGLLKARTELADDQGELAGVRARVEWWDSLVQAKVAGAETLLELKARSEVLERRIPVHEEAVATWEARVEAARKRLDAAGPESDDGLDAAAQARLAPLRALVEVARAKMAQLEARRDGLTLRAPGDGVVRRASMQPGEVATANKPVVVIRATPPRRIIAYASDAQSWTIHLGTAVTVIPRDGTRRPLRGHVSGIGAGMVPYPQHLQTNQNWRVMWGEEVVVALDEVAELVPGQVVDVRFESGDHQPDPAARMHAPSLEPAEAPDASAVAGAAEGGPEAVPAEAVLPEALRARSVVEASGLAWIEEWERFLVVSDDTGLPGQDGHPPWLFAMDAEGRFDEAPIVVEGIDELNDLESISRAVDGTLWALSSQSVSRKGNRPESRTLLVRMKVEDRKVVATGRASLAAALARLDATSLDGLGIGAVDPSFEKGAAGFDRVLEIEGMTSYGHALLLGLKQPLDGQGRAIVWRLARPERLVDTGELAADDLVVAGRVPLAGEGISDLLRLPDGGLAVLSASLDDAPTHSAMWTAAAQGGSEMETTKVADFPGLHAEGVAIGPDPGKVWLVFDRGGAEVPMWTRLPVPK